MSWRRTEEASRVVDTTIEGEEETGGEEEEAVEGGIKEK